MSSQPRAVEPLVFIAPVHEPGDIQLVADVNSTVSPQAAISLFLYLESVGFCVPVDEALSRINSMQMFDAALRSTGLAASNVHNFVGIHVDEPVIRRAAKLVVKDALENYRKRAFNGPVTNRNLMAEFICSLLLKGEKDRTLEDDVILPLLLQYSVSRLLEPFGLYLGDLVLLHSTTGTVLCGEFVEALLDYRIQPRCLDLFCGYGAESRVRSYLMNVGKFKLRGVKTEGNMAGVTLSVGLENASGMRIRLFQVAMFSPMQAVYPNPAVAGMSVIIRRPNNY